MNTEKMIGYTRDAGCVLVGLGGITYQIVTRETDAALLATCMTLLGITGAINVRQLRPSARSRNGGRGPSSSASSSGSSSPPPSEDGDE